MVLLDNTYAELQYNFFVVAKHYYVAVLTKEPFELQVVELDSIHFSCFARMYYILEIKN